MKKISISDIKNWKIAKKTKNLRAKPLLSIMVDSSIANNFLLNTLEGREPLGDGSVICIGESNDIWQQMPKKLLQKYDVVEIDKDGWMVCKPKPDSSVNCYEVNIIDSGLESEDTFYINGLWGEEYEGGLIQKGKSGDFILQDRIDSDDVWVVERKIFTNTYNINNNI